MFKVKEGELLSYSTKITDTPTTKEIWIYDKPIFRWINNDKENISEHLTEQKSLDILLANKLYDSLKRKQKHYEEMCWDVTNKLNNNIKFNPPTENLDYHQRTIFTANF